MEPFIAFLIQAKLHTYAAQGDAANVMPLLPGAKQLEYREGDWFYRDIYFGGDYFVGQETIYFQERPFWSMGYAGGLDRDLTTPPPGTYDFLQAALRRVQVERPFRGPNLYQEGDFVYQDASQGDTARFWGEESILFRGQRVYSLRYAGGMIR